MEKESKHVRFYELLDIHLANVLKSKFVNRSIDHLMLQEMYAVIRDTIESVFAKSNHKLTPEALRWLSMQYFKTVKLNDESTVRDLIVTNEYKLSELPYHDIQLMRNLFLETKLGSELDSEYQRRSAS